MAGSTIRYISLPRTEPPPLFVSEIIGVFRAVEDRIGTEITRQRMESNEVLRALHPGLEGLGFAVETGKKREQKIMRPVFFGMNGHVPPDPDQSCAT
jgi:hypothetical protein